MKKVLVFFVALIAFSCLFAWNGWAIEYDLESVKDITINYTDELVKPEPKAYLKGKVLCKDGFQLEVLVDTEAKEGQIGRYPITYTASFLFMKKEIKGYYNIVDLEAPVIEFEFFHDEYILPGEDYNAFIAKDNLDGDITDAVSVTVNTDNVVYSVQDTFGNETTVTKKLVTDETKVIYLTFDDGPSKYTSELLDILKKHNVKATFFVIGSVYSDIFSRMAEEGHAIGIHTYTHEFKDIYKNEESYFADLNKTQDLIIEKTGNSTKLLRFPGGSSNTISRKINKGIMSRLAVEVEKQGFTYFDWNVDSNDAGGAKDSDTVFENVKQGIEGKKKAVVLQHDTKKFSIDAVESIILWGKENGYVFLPLNVHSFSSHHKVLN